MIHEPVLTIDLEAICQNYHTLDAMSQTSTETAAVVKANAYGCGIKHVALALYNAGVRTFYVAQLEEAIELRQILVNCHSVTVSYFNGMNAAEAYHYNVIPVLSTHSQLSATHAGQRISIHLNSGMTRLGFDEMPDLHKYDVKCETILSHLACADIPEHALNKEQYQQFVRMTRNTTIKTSLAATGGILLGDAYHFDQTRPGIGLYGCAPFAKAVPVVTLNVPVIQIRTIKKGTPVGYGASWTAARTSRIATLPLGYADGIIRSAGNKAAFIWARGKKLPVIGRVSMDLITVDATDSDLTEGAFVEVFGHNISIDEWATQAGTIGYEFLTSLGRRYKRRYTGITTTDSTN